MNASTIKTGLACMLVLGLTTSYAAAQGSLTPPGSPAPTMHTLEEIYQKLTNTLAEVQTTQGQVADLQAIMIAMGMQPTSAGMVLILAGDFVMGDTFGEGDSDELPVHTNSVSAFWVDQTETTKTQWDEVYSWAGDNAYAFDNAGLGKEEYHPVHTVNWYDCVKWANARSEMDGFTPCYTINGAVYRTGTSDDVSCNWSADGYRLPTEAEWEKAASGGTANRRFPWSDVNTIQHTRANYYAAGGEDYDDSDGAGDHPDYDSGGTPYTSPVRSFSANGYGLHDMAGNLYEWCWDWYGSTYYASSPSSDPYGPGSGLYRVRRSGGCGDFASRCRVASRRYYSPGTGSYAVGFRLVRAAQ